MVSRIGLLARNVNIDMSDSKESVVFGLRLSKRERDDWEVHCNYFYRNISPQEALRMLLRLQMGTALDGSDEPLETGRPVMSATKGGVSKADRRIRAYVTESESDAISAVAKQSGISVSLWIARTLRSAIRIDSEPNPEELATLIESNKHLKILGRNMNQVARRLNQNFKEFSAEQLELEKQVAHINHHTKTVSKLIKSCADRWNLI